MSATATSTAARSERWFFGAMGVAMAVMVFWGFAPTFYLRPAVAGPLSPLLVAHGLAATAWMLLFVLQVALIAGRRVQLHRYLGAAGGTLAVVLVVVTTLASIVSRGFTARITFAAGAIVMFAIYIALGLLRRRYAGEHKRYMLLATIALLPPAIARLPITPDGSVPPNLIGLAFLLPPFVYDWVTRRRIHPALLWGGVFMIAMLPLRRLVQLYAAG